jgi:phosphate transport system substrate-binding protein
MRIAVFAASFTTLLGMPTATLAEDVQLHSYDGSLHLTGELIGYDQTGFTIETPLGPLLVASSLVTCEGAECPTVAQIHADLLASGYTVPSQTSSEPEAQLQKPHYCPHSAISVVSNANS